MKKIFFKTTLLCLLITLFSCGENKTEASGTPEPGPHNRVSLNDAQMKSAGIIVSDLRRMEMSGILKLTGRIEAPPQNRVSVSAPLGGYLRSTVLLPGMKVKKGQVIAVMEDQQFISIQQDYLTAKSEMLYAEQEFNRQQALNENKSGSDKVFQQAQAAYDSQNILMVSLAEKLRLIGIDPAQLTASTLSRAVNIYSPINGYVAKVNVNVGRFVNPSEAMFELVNPEDIHLALTVFEKDIDKLQEGQKIKAYSNNSGKSYAGEIILVGRNISEDRSTEVHCHFDVYDPALLPGMYMNADVQTKSLSVEVVPEESIVTYEGKDYLFVANGNNTFEMFLAETGLAENGLVEIRNASVFHSKKIVTKGAYSLLMSLKNTSE